MKKQLWGETGRSISPGNPKLQLLNDAMEKCVVLPEPLWDVTTTQQWESDEKEWWSQDKIRIQARSHNQAGEGGCTHKHSREQSSGAHKNKHGTKHCLKGLKHFLYFLGKPPGTVLTKSMSVTFNAVLLRGNGHHQTMSVDNGLFAALLRPLK